MQVAEALAGYRFMYCQAENGWNCIEQAERMIFLREYLLRRKAVPRIGTPQYGFVGAVGFSDVRLPALDGASATQPAAE